MFTLPTLKKQTGIPLYISLYEEIKELIITHRLETGEKLPSKRKLAVLLGVSLKTVENAYELLLLEGYIYTHEKKGYYVENLVQYRTDRATVTAIEENRFREKVYKVNLRANRNSREDFPDSVWNRLIRETLLEEHDALYHVVPFNGIYRLRKEIARYLRETRGMEVHPDQIIIGAGTEYLYGRLKQVLGKDCLYALPNPSTQRLLELYRNNDLHMQFIDADNDGLDMEQLCSFDCDVVHVSPAHQYPLGHAMLMQSRIELLKWVNERPGRYIIEDDYDSEYVIIGKPIPPLYSIDIRGKVIYMNTFSKSVGPAVRVSYMILPPELLNKYLETMSFYSCTVASLEQYALAAFIEKGHLDRYIRRTRRKTVQIKNTLLDSLLPLLNERSVTDISGNAGAHLLLRLNIDMTDAQIKQYLRQNDIIVSMLSEYYTEKADLHQRVLVINYAGLNVEQIDYFVDVLTMLVTN